LIVAMSELTKLHAGARKTAIVTTERLSVMSPNIGALARNHELGDTPA
jgi:hypothetical protein